MTDQVERDQERYLKAAHALQSGIAMRMNYDGGAASGLTSPKHMRVGVDSALSNQSALAGLLIEKGIITNEEYVKAMADAMEAEAESARKWLCDHLGTDNITLG